MWNIKTCINYLFLFLVLSYRIIITGVIHTDNSGLILMGVSLCCIVLNFRLIFKILHKSPFLIWFFWIIFVLFNYLFKILFAGNLVAEFSYGDLVGNFVYPLLAMIIVYIEYKNDSIRLLWGLFYIFLFYIVLTVFFDSSLFKIEKEMEYTEKSLSGNSFAINVCLIFFPLLLLKQLHKIKSYIFFISVIGLFLLLAFTGTRKGFGAGVIIILFYIASFVNFRSFKSIFFAIILIISAFYGYQWIMENTYMGKRMEYLEEQQNIYVYDDAPEILHLLGDRAPHYYFGWKIFNEKPFFGEGISQSRVKYGSRNFYIHSEYMVQLTDNGIFGFLLFAGFYFWFFKRLLKRIRGKSPFAMICCGAFISICFMNVTAWTWDTPAIFMVFGLLCGYLTIRNNLFETAKV